MAGFRAVPAGDAAVLLEFGSEIDEEVNEEAQRLAQALLAVPPEGVYGVVPAYTTVLIEYNPLITSSDAVVDHANSLTQLDANLPSRRFLVPTCYGGDFGPDLAEVAERLRLSPARVVERHAGQDFRIFCLGFSPGFPLCGILPDDLETPRRPTPRPKVPAGSVGLAGRQTGVYPATSPGGWQLIGRTPVPLFDVHKDPPVVFRPGDSLRFVPITDTEYRRLESAAACGDLTLEEDR